MESSVEQWTPSPEFGIFGITQNGKVVCNVMINTNPAVLGDSLQLQADFQDTDLRCEQVIERMNK